MMLPSACPVHTHRSSAVLDMQVTALPYTPQAATTDSNKHGERVHTWKTEQPVKVGPFAGHPCKHVLACCCLLQHVAPSSKHDLSTACWDHKGGGGARGVMAPKEGQNRRVPTMVQFTSPCPLPPPPALLCRTLSTGPLSLLESWCTDQDPQSSKTGHSRGISAVVQITHPPGALLCRTLSTGSLSLLDTWQAGKNFVYRCEQTHRIGLLLLLLLPCWPVVTSPTLWTVLPRSGSR
jgi:hypothetical protein